MHSLDLLTKRSIFPGKGIIINYIVLCMQSTQIIIFNNIDLLPILWKGRQYVLLLRSYVLLLVIG